MKVKFQKKLNVTWKKTNVIERRYYRKKSFTNSEIEKEVKAIQNLLINTKKMVEN